MHSFAPFSNLNVFVKTRQFFFAIELINFINSIAKNSNFAFFLRIFDEFFSGFRAKFQKIVTCAAFSIKFAKTNQKFAENSEFCEKNSLLLVNYSLHSLVVIRGRASRLFSTSSARCFVTVASVEVRRIPHPKSQSKHA